MQTKQLIGLIILTVGLIWGLMAWASKGAPNQKPTASQPSNKTQHPFTPTAKDELVLGSASAPVEIIEYADVQCPYCAIANRVLNQLLEQNPKKIRLIYRNFVLSYHQFAQAGALALQAANRQGKFKEMKDALFSNQKTLSNEKIRQLAQQIGLDMQKYNQDLRDPLLTKKIDYDRQTGLNKNIQGTPTIFVNGQEFKQFYDIDKFQKEIDRLAK